MLIYHMQFNTDSMFMALSQICFCNIIKTTECYILCQENTAFVGVFTRTHELHELISNYFYEINLQTNLVY